jgi:hypothetical protein
MRHQSLRPAVRRFWHHRRRPAKSRQESLGVTAHMTSQVAFGDAKSDTQRDEHGAYFFDAKPDSNHCQRQQNKSPIKWSN